MRFCARIIISVALQQVDHAPNAKTGSEGNDEGLQHIDCAIEEMAAKSLYCHTAEVTQGDLAEPQIIPGEAFRLSARSVSWLSAIVFGYLDWSRWRLRSHASRSFRMVSSIFCGV